LIGSIAASKFSNNLTTSIYSVNIPHVLKVHITLSGYLNFSASSNPSLSQILFLRGDEK